MNGNAIMRNANSPAKYPTESKHDEDVAKSLSCCHAFMMVAQEHATARYTELRRNSLVRRGASSSAS